MIKRTQSFVLVTLLISLALAGKASAHFQLLYTPKVSLAKAQSIEMRLVFGHPLDNGHVMEMGAPEAFYYLHKGKRVDLMKSLKPITWKGPENAAAAFAARVKIKRNGDYVFVAVPSPYYEDGENKYIQQITKSFVNKGGLPTGWEKPLGLKTEIVPLNKPTNVLAGGTFSGQVLADGKPVPGAEIEVEWINGKPDPAGNAFGPSRVAPRPSALVAISDANGVFTFGVPKAGTWGFAALNTGPDKRFKGKELSQDAVIWIHATEMR